MTNAALPALQQAGRAAIVNVSSGVAVNPPAPVLHYGAVKAALASWSKGLAAQLAPAGVRGNTVTLGMVETPGGTELLQSMMDAMGGSVEQGHLAIPLGRAGDPRDVAEAVAFLVSDRAQWIAGADLHADGAAG